jgi:hypothetical protein
MGKTIDAPRLSGIAAEREARDSALLALSNQIGHKPSSRAADPQHLGATQGPQGSPAGANKGLSLYAAKASGGWGVQRRTRLCPSHQQSSISLLEHPGSYRSELPPMGILVVLPARHASPCHE